MGAAVDQMVADLTAEIEEKQAFQDGVLADAKARGEDLTQNEMELYQRATQRIAEMEAQRAPLVEGQRVANESKLRTAEIAKTFAEARGAVPAQIEYRSAGAFVLDYWRGRTGNDEARDRIERFNRAAAHQTTADNPGLLPEQILLPVLNFIDTARPVIGVLGPRNLPSGSWSRPSITQHTQVAAQTAEKTELVSRKMTIGKIPVTAKTYGGYVNVSRQDADWSQPAIMDIVIADLAAQYAVETENATVDDLTAAATAGPVIPTGAPTAAAVGAAYWAAAGQVYAATKGIGRLFAFTGIDTLGWLGPLFPSTNPTNAQSSGFDATDISSGLVGSVAGIPTYVSVGMPANTIVVTTTAAAEVYEDRVGALQVVEPSVLGTQVAYAGYFADVAILPAGIVKITKTP